MVSSEEDKPFRRFENFYRRIFYPTVNLIFTLHCTLVTAAYSVLSKLCSNVHRVCLELGYITPGECRDANLAKVKEGGVHRRHTSDDLVPSF